MLPIRNADDVDRIENFVSEARTHLTPIIGYSEFLLIGAAGELTPEQHQIIERIRRSVDALQELCTRLLADTRET